MSVQSTKLATLPGFNPRLVAVFVLRLIGVALVVVLIPIAFNMEWRNFEKIFEKSTSIRFIALGLAATISVSLVAILASLPIATALALGRLSNIRWVRWPSTAFIEVVRSLPLLLLIFYLNLRLPALNLFALTGITDTSDFFGRAMQIILSPAAVSVTLALTLYTAAVNAELLRSGILSLDRGQTEASRSLGLTYWQTMRRVILPQAYRRTLAPLIAQFTILVKDTSLGSIIGFVELKRSSEILAEQNYNAMESLYIVTIIYFAVNYLLGLTIRLVERKGPSVPARSLEF